MKFFILVLACGLSISGMAQSNVFIHFTPKIGGQYVTSNDLGLTVYNDLNGIAFEVDRMSYYISKLKLTHDGGQETNFNTPEDVKLVKITNTVFALGSHSITSLEQVDFGVGVPSEWNHLDINTYASGHPLGNQQNPVMHWGWTAGYFHMALDAMGDNNSDDICDQGFQPHCLGDGNYKNVSLPMTGVQEGNEFHIYIICNIDEWIYGLNPGTAGIQHTDGGVAITAMNNVESRNVFEAQDDLGVLTVEEEVGLVYFSNTEEALTLGWKEMNGMDNYQLINMNGKVISEGQNSSPSAQITVADLGHSSYIFNCYDANGKRIHSATVMH